jgi:uncharacterized protein (TIGR02996 family)
MSDREALLRAILEAPDDDAPRLVYADWLQESGWDWEAIHLRYAVANPEGVWCRLPLALLRGLRPPARMPEWTRTAQGQGEIGRGFVCSVEVEPAHFLEIAADLFAFQPVTRVRLTGAYPRRIFWAGTWGWNAGTAHSYLQSHLLPGVLYDSLDLTTGARWPSVEEAERQLSRACVRYGRRLAGLSPLDAV